MENDSRILSENLHMVMSYSGPVLDDHEMDAALFAEAVLANAAIARQVANIVFGPEIIVTVKIKGVTENGVQAELVYVFKQVAETIHLIRENTFVAGVVDFSEITGAAKFVGKIGYSIYSWIKNHKSDGIKFIEEHGDTATVFYNDGTKEVISSKLYRALYSLKVVNAIKKVIAPLSREGINKFKFFERGKNTSPATVVSKEDIPAFRSYIISQLNYTKEYEIVCFLDRPSYQRKASGWKLVRDGQPDITATIKDKQFLNDVAEDRIKVDPYSLFIVKYSEIRKENKDGTISKRYEVASVKPIENE